MIFLQRVLSTKKLIFLLFLLPAVFLPLSVNAAPQIEILPNHTSYVDSIGYFNVIGEVHNIGDQAADHVGVTATFYDDANDVVATRSDWIALPVLLPDRKSPFRVEFVDVGQSALVDHYSLEIDEFTPTDSIPKQLQITSQNSSYVLDTLEILGEIENTGDSTATIVGVFATCYDEAGNVVQVGGAYAEPVDIETNQKGTFEIWIDLENTELIDSYTLTAASENYALIPEFTSLISLMLAVTLLSISILICKRKIIRN